MENLPKPTTEAPTQSEWDTLIQDPNVAYDVAHDSVVQARQEELQTTQKSADYFVARGGNPQAAEQAVAEAHIAANKAIEDAATLYESPQQ